MKKPNRDMEAIYLQTLAQSVAEREREVNDYACNAYAEKIAQINVLLGVLDPGKDAALIKELTLLKDIYRKIGTAVWFTEAGELTNLGARLGSTIKQYKVRE